MITSKSTFAGMVSVWTMRSASEYGTGPSAQGTLTFSPDANEKLVRLTKPVL